MGQPGLFPIWRDFGERYGRDEAGIEAAPSEWVKQGMGFSDPSHCFLFSGELRLFNVFNYLF